jgi:hypothetical protein
MKFILFFLVIQIFSETKSYEKNKFYFDLGFGSLNTKVSDAASAETFSRLYFIYDLNPLLQSPNLERRNLGLYKLSEFEESKILNYNSRFGIEYSILKFLGIGASLNNSNTKVTNVLPGDYLILFAFGLLPQEPKNSLPEISNYQTLLRRDLKARISSLDLELSFHYPISNFDFYTRFGYGKILQGSQNPSIANKTSSMLGVKAFYSKIFISLEYYHATIIADLGRSDYAIENGFRFGFGI